MHIDETTIQSIGFVIGGLALFIYGINQMSDGLKSIAGYHIREYIEKYTSNLLMSILVGTIISAILHSSSAVTVISISLVRAGLMRLEQAIGITIGANIGTCATSIMIGLNIEQFAYYFVCVGVVMMLLAKRKNLMYVGKVLLGFGMIFVGLQVMSDQLLIIAKEDWFSDIMVTLGQNPWLALLGGTIATGIMQSSTAIIGIVQKLYITGLISPMAGIAFIYGANVGTTITAVIASFGGSISTKRAAIFHVVYNIAGALLGMLVLSPFVSLTAYVNTWMHGGSEMYIALAHFIFNIVSTILVIPFVGQCVRLLKIIVPGEDHRGVKIENIDELDDTLIERFPAAALEVAKKNTQRMGRNVIANIETSKTYLESKKQEDYDEIVEIEALVNKYDTRLGNYLLKIAQHRTLASNQTKEYYRSFQTIKSLERISDLVVDITDFYQLVYEDNGSFSNEATKDLKEVYNLVVSMIQDAMYIYETRDFTHRLITLQKKEEQLNELELLCRQRHFDRMCNGVCNNSSAASVILDILSTLESMGDIALSIASSMHQLNYHHDEKISTNIE